MIIKDSEEIYTRYPLEGTQGSFEVILVAKDGKDRTLTVYVGESNAYNFRVDQVYDLLEVSVDYLLRELKRDFLRTSPDGIDQSAFTVVALGAGEGILICNCALIFFLWLLRFKHFENQDDSLIALMNLVTRGFQAIANDSLRAQVGKDFLRRILE